MPNFIKMIREMTESGQNDPCGDMDDALANAVRAIEETGGPATITLTLKLKPKGESKISVDYSVNEKLPKVEQVASIFFTADGDLFRTNPKQGQFDFDGVHDPRAKDDETE
jgi:hypothetical protein